MTYRLRKASLEPDLLDTQPLLHRQVCDAVLGHTMVVVAVMTSINVHLQPAFVTTCISFKLNSFQYLYFYNK